MENLPQGLVGLQMMTAPQSCNGGAIQDSELVMENLPQGLDSCNGGAIQDSELVMENLPQELVGLQMMTAPQSCHGGATQDSETRENKWADDSAKVKREKKREANRAYYQKMKERSNQKLIDTNSHHLSSQKDLTGKESSEDVAELRREKKRAANRAYYHKMKEKRAKLQLLESPSHQFASQKVANTSHNELATQDPESIEKKTTDVVSEKREKKRAADKAYRQKVRANAESRAEEQVANTISRQRARQDPERLEKVRAGNRASHQTARADPNRRQEEQVANTISRQRARQDPERLEKVRAGNRASHQTARADPNRRQEEQVANTISHQRARQDPERLEKLRAGNRASHQTARADPNRCQKEQVANTISHQLARQDPERLEKERAAKKAANQIARADPIRRQEEQLVNTASHSIARKNPLYRTPEKDREKVAKRLSLSNPTRRRLIYDSNNEIHRRNQNLQRSNYDLLLKQYKEKSRRAPSFICSCCGGLWYEESMSNVSTDLLKKWGSNDVDIALILHVPQEEHQLCGTCRNHVRRTKMPPRLSLSNGLDFPSIPDELKDLFPLEERLVALRIPFMQVRLLGLKEGNLIGTELYDAENVVLSED